MKTSVYIDGFNLYYGCVKRTPHRWLDIVALARALTPKHTIGDVRYFTAKVSTLPGDGDGQQPQRQQAYLRALATLPGVSIHYGHYLAGTRTMPLASPSPTGPKFAAVIKMEEKGSDVNLATMLLVDAFRGRFEQALVISNDSDLALPIELVTKELGLPVGVVFPCSLPNRHPSAKLKQVAKFTREVRTATLAACQLPASLTDSHGTITKPVGW